MSKHKKMILARVGDKVRYVDNLPVNEKHEFTGTVTGKRYYGEAEVLILGSRGRLIFAKQVLEVLK